MTAEWGMISQELMKRGILVTTGVKERLLTLRNPFKVLDQGEKIGFERGMLSIDVLNELVDMAGNSASNEAEKIRQPIGRTIAPVNEPEPVNIQYRNNLPDWSEKDFSGMATDVDNDILIHYDITGNSTTEGKMGHIQACFNDRLESIRKMIVKNSRLPRKPQEIGRLNIEYQRYQGYENLAVAIGLVNDPRHTKNGHLMFGLEDETGDPSGSLSFFINARYLMGSSAKYLKKAQLFIQILRMGLSKPHLTGMSLKQIYYSYL